MRLWLEPLAAAGFHALEPGEGLSAQERHWAAALAAPLAQRYRASRLLLRRRLAPLLGCAPVAVPLHSPPGQRPLLRGGAGWVSLSHSGSALLLAWSPKPIGVDLEWAGRPLAAAALAARHFPPAERRRLQGLAPLELQRAVLRSWVVKEAAIKWGGRSLAAELRHWCWNDCRAQLEHSDGTSPEVLIRPLAGWFCALVGEGVSADQGPIFAENVSRRGTDVSEVEVKAE